MSLQLAVGNAVATLTAVSQACKGAVQLWILHGLYLTANAAGLAYVPYCKVSCWCCQTCTGRAVYASCHDKLLSCKQAVYHLSHVSEVMT